MGAARALLARYLLVAREGNAAQLHIGGIHIGDDDS
jgi:hypothetical protein